MSAVTGGYNDRFNGIDVSTVDKLKAQTWDKAKRQAYRRGTYTDSQTRRWLAKIGYSKRRYRERIRTLSRQA